MDKGTYLVTVTDRSTNTTIDRHHFPIGQWKEIGYWLDNLGYIDSRYSVKVHFTEPGV
jgi:hypothetical protein